MSEPIPIPESWFFSAAGVIGTLLLGIFEYFRRKVDRLEVKQQNFISRDELAAIEIRIEARALATENRSGAMHVENSNNFRELRLQLESVNSKLFELASKK